MKRIYRIAALVPALALAAAAQDDLTAQKRAQEALQKVWVESKVMGIAGGAMGETVKGTPYAATEVVENTQVLADGTRIHNERQTSVYRDSEGRVRRETPDQVTIWDPVTSTTYFLDPKTQTAQKAVMRTFFYHTTNGGSDVKVVDRNGDVVTHNVTGPASENKVYAEMRTDVKVINRNGEVSATVNGQPVDPEKVKLIAPPPASGEFVMHTPGPAGEVGLRAFSFTRGPEKSESLGTQMMEGVSADGSRSTTTLDVGAIGNDRPINIVTERWYSPDLKTVVMTKRTDPRTGEESFRLQNVSRGEPPASLFQVPSNYQLIDRK